MSIQSFGALDLQPPILQAITDMGFEVPTPIQAETIPLLMEGKDVIGQAQTGTGKTAAFGIPILQMMEPGEKNVTAVVLCPTRELAIQVSKEIATLGKYYPTIKALPIYGGESIQLQIRELKKNVQIVVGTPGRVLDHLNRGTLSFEKVRLAVLDEADEMLNMGFREDIEMLLGMMPVERQTLLFSATMPTPILDIARQFLKKPRLVRISNNNLTAQSIEQWYFDTLVSEKPFLIRNLVDFHSMKTALVFCNTKKQVDELVLELLSLGLNAEGLHGDLSQPQRLTVLNRFKTGDSRILVATDVAARGIDIINLEGVFNFDIPHDPENYVHRIGRTGRAGKTGMAFSFVTGRNDFRKLKAIEEFAGVRIHRKIAPSAPELFEAQKLKLFTRVSDEVETGTVDKFYPVIEEFYRMGIGPRDLCAALLQMNLKSTQPPPEAFGNQPARTSKSSRPAATDRGEPGGPPRRKTPDTREPAGGTRKGGLYQGKDKRKSDKKRDDGFKAGKKKGGRKQSFNFYYN